MRRVCLGLVILTFFVCSGRAGSQNLVSDCPAGPVSDLMARVVAAFPKDTNIKIDRISCDGKVEDVAKTAQDMLSTTIVIGFDESGHNAQLFDYDQIKKEVSPAVIDRFLESLQLNLSPGDILILIQLSDSRTKKQVKSLNSMRPDGRMFSGGFFSTARLPGGFRTRFSQENTECKTEVLTTYLWGSPAETAQGCVRASCEGAKCVGCVVTYSNGFGGFFGHVEIVPPSGTKGSIVTLDSKHCCDGYFKWAWTTGFKSIKVSADKVSLAIEGRIGQSGNGSFTVTECCPHGTPAPNPNPSK